MRYFRGSFTSSKGLEGHSLIDWKSKKQQAALVEMTNAFLERDGMGRQFWPGDETSDRFNSLKYSTDHALIKETIRQLFWRMNLQTFRNAKYRTNINTKDSATEEDTTAGRGLRNDSSIEVVLVSDGAPSRNGGEMAESPRDNPLLTVMSSNLQNPNTRNFALYTTMVPLTQRSETNDSTSALTESSSRGTKRHAVVHSSDAPPRKRQLRRTSQSTPWDDCLEAGESSDREVPGLATSGDVVFAEDGAAPGDSASDLTKKTPVLSSRSTPRGTPPRESTEIRSITMPLTDKAASPVIVRSEHERHDEPAHGACSMKRGPSQTPQVEISYQITAWYPKHLSRPWIPKGSFRSKTLSELQEEIPVNLGDSHVTGLQFLVKAPGVDAEYFVPHGRDERFNEMKENLELAIRNGIAKAVKDRRLLLDIGIKIEVMTDMDSTSRLDDIDFEW
ncbi:hypothetical protein CTRI78_v007871 [Colletotrichum trifolii]|uniref:Uncharacterized protein n=1 Tax=Colletotrichum trifolii TaxID=5466 RepID=A0A4R8R0Y9_COLTR|nr:hypothetical protein CTRI78_v007871 [Colletotrichum trifolii]